MSRSPMTARRLFDRFEPVHALTYFTQETRAAFDAAGYRGFWMGYFAGRAAPLGQVSAEVVASVFYNFSLPHVSRALPSAWTYAPPAVALRARSASSVAALQRCGVTDTEPVRQAVALLERAARSADWAGRPLFAANAALPWPDETVARLWHAATLLREHRGDAHVAVLSANGIGGRDCNVLHALADRVPKEFIVRSREYDDAEWDAHLQGLIARGLVDATGGLTAAGREVKQHVEDTTDALALPAFDALDDDEIAVLFRTLGPITRAVIAAGDIPVATPMGMGRDDLHDDSAHLT